MNRLLATMLLMLIGTFFTTAAASDTIKLGDGAQIKGTLDLKDGSKLEIEQSGTVTVKLGGGITCSGTVTFDTVGSSGTATIALERKDTVTWQFQRDNSISGEQSNPTDYQIFDANSFFFSPNKQVTPTITSISGTYSAPGNRVTTIQQQLSDDVTNSVAQAFSDSSDQVLNSTSSPSNIFVFEQDSTGQEIVLNSGLFQGNAPVTLYGSIANVPITSGYHGASLKLANFQSDGKTLEFHGNQRRLNAPGTNLTIEKSTVSFFGQNAYPDIAMTLVDSNVSVIKSSDIFPVVNISNAVNIDSKSSLIFDNASNCTVSINSGAVITLGNIPT
ncbi:MAG: hypothetical protein LBF56_01770 [Holosporales bacterium]|jgi:hypothetical protein|nr:hypothetical protein [Holosporales bacterium]